MRLLLAFFIITGVYTFSNSQNTIVNNLSAIDFDKKIKKSKSKQVIDVRTIGEFNGSHLINAINFNISDQNFANNINSLDKNKEVFLYCLTGARSAYAGKYLISNGFKKVYNLEKGIIEWNATKLPTVTSQVPAKNNKTMTIEEYNKIINSGKTILVNFYAVWCAPCKNMAPYFDELSTEFKGKVGIIRIDADANKQLLIDLGIQSIPTTKVYKNKKNTWEKQGFIEKDEIKKQIH